MKIATFTQAGERRVGLVDIERQTIAPFDFTVEEAHSGLLAVIDRNGRLPATLSPVPIGQVEIEAPIPRPRRNIFCVGKNYYEHAHEFAKSGFDSSAAAGAVPKEPIIFSKLPETVVANHARVIIDPAVSTAIDYEAELAVIIGKSGRRIAKEDVFDHVWGYTIVNDVTARDLQGKYSQWLIGKSQDTFCPMGPWAVSKDEIDIVNAGIRSFVNGEPRQEARIGMLIFDIPTLVSTISQGITLNAGDIIATGTPAGVGIGFDPPKYLKAGDVVRVEIDGIGTLENRFAEAG
jgi:2-keto-4-pentenoate hydratase/2-oxohepta-3-ene-1,7-dioic acid hydratase in catechol pathway